VNQVRCITRDDRYSPHDRITQIGGVNPDGSNWRLALAEAIQGIKTGKWRFFVERPLGDRVIVIVASRNGREYLKTEADGDEPNNLLSLPMCVW
jgi:hypothetical protein